MSTVQMTARLDRTEPGTSWGFRLYGGKDFGVPLTIQRVTPGSLAHKCGLQVGDSIMRIGAESTAEMRHKEAQGRIVSSGNSLELTLQRGGQMQVGPAPSAASHAAPPPQSYQPYQPAPYHGPPVSASDFQDHNRTAAPFAPGGSGVPLVVNNQYNTPLHLYSVDNVVDSLGKQTGLLNLGPGGSPAHHGQGAVIDPTPPWRSGPGSRMPPAAAPSYSSPPSAAPSGGASWAPRIPTGPRKMRSGRPGEAKSMPAVGGTARIPICDTCGIAIRGPFVLALDKSWCPNHFNCSNPTCNKPLIGVGFVEEAGQLLCEQDYEKYLAPRCGKCSNAIMRECVNALNNTWHPECFLCSQCGNPIGSGAFHIEEGKNYCEKDWQALFQTKCYGCQFPIEPGDRWVDALNENWHSECFNCSTCQVNLEGQGFYAKGGKPYCKKHAAGGTKGY